MGTLSHAITAKLALPRHDFSHRRSSSSSSSYYGLPYLNSRFPRLNSTRLAKKIRVSAESNKQRPSVDYNDPEWKSKFQKDFESRFNIPHITDVFDDAVPIPSTFCLKMRSASLSFLVIFIKYELEHSKLLKTVFCVWNFWCIALLIQLEIAQAKN
jgi:6-phosphofructokinase 1